jgi:hypothetical protein
MEVVPFGWERLRQDAAAALALCALIIMPCSELVPGQKYKVRDYGNPKYAGLIVVFSHIGIGNVAIVKPVPGQNVDYNFGVPIKELVPCQ